MKKKINLKDKNIPKNKQNKKLYHIKKQIAAKAQKTQFLLINFFLLMPIFVQLYGFFKAYYLILILELQIN